jgi:hypothetical protein
MVVRREQLQRPGASITFSGRLRRIPEVPYWDTQNASRPTMVTPAGPSTASDHRECLDFAEVVELSPWRRELDVGRGP